MENGFNQFQCPLCGRSVSIMKFDPTNFVDDVIGIRFMGLGYGRGFGVADKGSILDSCDSVLALVSDRVLKISRFLLDAGNITDEMLASHLLVSESRSQADAREELIDDINDALETYYGDDAFDNLFNAAMALLAQFLDYEEEDEDEEAEDEEEEDKVDFESLSDLDKELFLAELEEEEAEDEDDE